MTAFKDTEGCTFCIGSVSESEDSDEDSDEDSSTGIFEGAGLIEFIGDSTSEAEDDSEDDSEDDAARLLRFLFLFLGTAGFAAGAISQQFDLESRMEK